MMKSGDEMAWWKTATIYEIYPKSFYSQRDSHDGDIQGIISKLDYLSELGIDALWLCPIFQSPFKDSGYDISDYYQINPDFGSMADFDQLIEEAHRRGIKVLLDMVINHTSDRHPWFISACQSADSPYRDYYIFRKGSAGKYPNNWVSSKTLGPVWSLNQSTEDYYLHIYTKHQPDLNWENPALREELYTMLGYWLNKGVDGYRLDVINKIAKKRGLPDFDYNDTNLYADAMFENNAGVHTYLKEMRQRISRDYPEALLMGQIAGISEDQAFDYVHPDRKELDLYLQFEHMDIDRGHEGRRKSWTVKQFRDSVMKWQRLSEQGVWPTVFFGSHDATRMMPHFGNSSPAYGILSAKMLVTLQLCLRGTQVIYMGDEWGLDNVKYNRIHDFSDIRTHGIYQKRLEKGESAEDILSDLRFSARDNARYPLPWSAYDAMVGNQESVVEFYKRIIAFRKKEQCLLDGAICSLALKEKDVFAYQRTNGHVIITVIANMGQSSLTITMNGYGEQIIGNYDHQRSMKLRPYEVRVFRLEQPE